MSNSANTPLERASRLLDLVPYLSTHQGVELSKLAQVFHISSSQLVADLTTLWMCGLPGYTPLELMELSFDSGFVTIHNAQTLARPRTLNDEESIALLLGLDLVIAALPDDREDLKVQARELVQRLSARSGFPGKLSAASTASNSVEVIVEDAMRANKDLEISYHSLYSDTLTTRVISPIDLKSENGFQYLSAHCDNAKAVRVFRLDRIVSAQIQPGRAGARAVISERESNKISFEIAVHSRVRASLERFSLPPSVVSAPLHSESFSPEWIIRSVFASSGSVELLSPPDMRQRIATSAQSLLQLYESS